MSLHTQISTLTGRVGTHHTTTETHREREAQSNTNTHNDDGSRQLITCSQHMQKVRAAGVHPEVQGGLPGGSGTPPS